VRAALANELVSKDTLIEVLDYFLLFLPFNKCLNSINGHIEEFIDILLDHGINR
jgi:hypothetical protein